MDLQLIGLTAHSTAHISAGYLNIRIVEFISCLGIFLWSPLYVLKFVRQPDWLFRRLKHWLLTWDAGTAVSVYCAVRIESLDRSEVNLICKILIKAYKPCIQVATIRNLWLSYDSTTLGMYSRINSTNSSASDAGNISEPTLMSQVGRVRKVVCA